MAETEAEEKDEECASGGEAQLKTERKENLKRKQEAWKQQIQKCKRQKVNPPNVAAREEDDEKQPEEVEDVQEDQPNQSEVEDHPVESEDDLSDDLEDIFKQR